MSRPFVTETPLDVLFWLRKSTTLRQNLEWVVSKRLCVALPPISTQMTLSARCIRISRGFSALLAPLGLLEAVTAKPRPKKSGPSARFSRPHRAQNPLKVRVITLCATIRLLSNRTNLLQAYNLDQKKKMRFAGLVMRQISQCSSPW